MRRNSCSKDQRIGAGDLVAAQHAAFELADQQRARLRREFAQVLPQPFDRVGARHRRLYPRLDRRGLIDAAGVNELIKHD